jgi:ABC-type glycerol-3-phosphate transport system substrate-binding protein
MQLFKRLTALAIFGLALLLTACGSAGQNNGVTDPIIGEPPRINPNIPQSKEKITLDVWLDLDFTRNDGLFTEIAKDFESAYRATYQRDITVSIKSFTGESIPQKVRLAVLNGVPPDVVQGHVYALAGQGLAEPLDRRWDQWGPNTESQFLPAALNEVTWKQTKYGIPLDVYTLILLYNRDHFEKAGLPLPTGDYTPANLQQAVMALTIPAEDRYGIGFTADPRYVYTWMAGAGGDVLTGVPETGITFTFNSKSNIDALSFLTGMAQAGYGPLPTTRPRDYEDARDLFLAGKASIYMGGPWDIHLIQSQYPDFPLGVAQLPKTPAADSAASVLGSTGLFIPRGARHQDISFEFMKWATSDKYAIPMARRLGRYPAKTWMQTSPYLTENLLLTPFFNQLNAARPYRLDLYPAAEEAFQKAIKASFYGLNPVDALNEAQAKAEQLLVRKTAP